MPGIGPWIAAALIALLPELGPLIPGQVAVLTGVAPWARETATGCAAGGSARATESRSATFRSWLRSA
ncbi:MAG: hypothetical protein ACU0A9_15655 [Alterinioella nitratireducens]|uniref:hypothetical protein n=1 Tax=Alterinioella nitratireducens TaxID=2735915 RepID=UPI00405A1A52